MKFQLMLKKYAISAVDYILNNLSEQSFTEIRQVILFGSVSRGTATKDSDIDIFFYAVKSLKKEINKLIEDFYISRQGLIFKTKGVANRFQVIVGDLQEWVDLHKSIASEGIVLYGPYYGKPPKGLKHYFMISWENLDIKNRGAFLNKFYGYTAKKIKYSGLVKKWRAEKIGKSAILLPFEHKEECLNILSKYKVDFRIKDIYL